MKKIAILTATYNHPNELFCLFKSLEEQKNKNFTWIIVNDGSKEETSLLLKNIEKEATIDLKVINQENSGKSSAINNGLDNLDNYVKFIVIVDDDEKLYPNASELIEEYYNKYKNTECGVIHFNRKNEKNEIIASPIIDKDFYKSYQDFKAEKRHADGYIAYFVDKLGDNRFVITPGEKYVSPSTLFMKVTKTSKLLWAKAVLGQTEYLESGITKQGRKLRIKNPKGMIEYCGLMYEGSHSFKQKLLISTMGYAYIELCNKKCNYNKYNFNIIGKVPGVILAKIWRNKYR